MRPVGSCEPSVAKGCCGGVVIVDRLLDSDGTSSQDPRTAGPGSPNVKDRLSVVLDEVAVPKRGVLNETWLVLNPRVENEDPLNVSGVMIACGGSGSEKLRGCGFLVSSAVRGGVTVVSESRVKEDARGSSKSSTTSTGLGSRLMI